MQWLRLHWICRRGTALCHANGETWGEMDTTVRQFHSGDHCRVQIRSAREDWCDLEHIEALARQQRIILSSPEGQDEEEDPQEDDVPSRSQSTETARSRSRERQRGLHLLQTALVRLRAKDTILTPQCSAAEAGVFLIMLG